MLGTTDTTSNLALAARRIEADLRSRPLAPGDRYLSVGEAAALLGVSSATAHRAMSLLVDRGLLTRQHGRGTFVGNAVGDAKCSVSIRTVYVLLPEDQVDVTGVQLDVMVAAIRKHFGGASVQFAFVPKIGDVDYVREVIGAAERMGQLAGAVPISCSRSVYRYLADTGAPVVVLGSVYDDQRDLPSVDLDYQQAGYLLAKHLIDRGCRRLALLSTGDGRPGDNAFYDGISQALTEVKLPHNALVVRIFPRDLDAFATQMRELFRREDRPTATICGSHRFAPALGEVLEELGLRVPRDVELAFASQATADAQRLPYVHVQPEMSFDQMADLVAGMLKQRSLDGVLSPARRVVVPAVLKMPPSATDSTQPPFAGPTCESAGNDGDPRE